METNTESYLFRNFQNFELENYLRFFVIINITINYN